MQAGTLKNCPDCREIVCECPRMIGKLTNKPMENKDWREEFEKDIEPMIENEVLYRYDNLELAQDSADTLNKGIRQFITTKIAQAEKSGKDRMREELGCICKILAPASVHFEDCPLGKCHQALEDLKPIINNLLK